MSQCEMLDTTRYQLTIYAPDDFGGMPIYEGDPGKVHERLLPGAYRGWIHNLATGNSANVKVYVYDHFTQLGRFVMFPKV